MGQVRYPSRVGPPGTADVMDGPERPARAGAGQGLGSPLARGLSAEGARVPGQEAQARSGGARGQETVVPAPPGQWQPGRGWCRCRRGPWYRRAARTVSRRGPPRSSADTKPWFPRDSARGTRCHRPCPTRGTQRKVSLGPGGRSFQPLASPSGPPRVSFDPSTPRNPEPCPGKLLSLGPAPRKSKEPVQCSEAVSGAQAHKDLLCKINKIIPTGLIFGA